MRRPVKYFAVLLVCSTTVVPPQVSAQVRRATLEGIVIDERGQPLADVEVDAENLGGHFRCKTDVNGHYEIKDMPVGGWKISASALGFKPLSTTWKLLAFPATQSLDLVLERDISTFFEKPLTSPVPLGAGIQPLDQDSYELALQTTEDDVATISSPLLLKLQSTDRESIDTAVRLGKDAPFSVTISTPYVRVAATAAEARRKFRPVPLMSIQKANDEGVSIVVRPGSFLAADAVEDVVIKRGDNVVRPLSTNVEPVTIENANGAKRDVSRGTFKFPMNALTPKAPVTIIIIGKTRNLEIPMTAADLSRLR